MTNSNGNYYVSVLTEFEKKIQKIPSSNKVIGLDFSMSELFVSSENQRADYPRYFKMLEKKLKKSLSRKVKFSKNWYRQKSKISKLIDKWFPSSKTCSRCGNIKEKLKLSERSYRCECCEIEIDRDYNAALNLKNIGKEMLKY